MLFLTIALCLKTYVTFLGFDVLCHAIEAYWNIHHQPICDALAIHATRLALDNITQVYDNPQDKQARENMAEASVTAGLAFNMPKTTSAHACAERRRRREPAG